VRLRCGRGFVEVEVDATVLLSLKRFSRSQSRVGERRGRLRAD
jgi:hypothetical protein